MQKEIERTLRHEGGFVNNPNDSGGATFAGLSLRYMMQAGDRDKNGTFDFDLNNDGKVDAADVKLLTIDAVADELKKSFFDKLRLAEINSLHVRWKVFDIAVTSGQATAAAILQRCVDVEADGVIGNMTLAKVNARLSSGFGEHVMMDSLIEAQVKYYTKVALANKKNIEFLYGWIKRAFDRANDLC